LTFPVAGRGRSGSAEEHLSEHRRLALPPASHAFWRQPDAPQQALSVLASVERERAAAQVAQRALTSAAEFLTKKNAKLKAELSAARQQLEGVNNGGAGSRRAVGSASPGGGGVGVHANAGQAPGPTLGTAAAASGGGEHGGDTQALQAAQAEVRALRRRVAGLEDALADAETKQARAVAQAAQRPQQAQPDVGGGAHRMAPSPGVQQRQTGGHQSVAGVDIVSQDLREELEEAYERIDELEARLEDAAAAASAGADAADAAIAAERAKTQAALSAWAAATGDGAAAAARAECDQLRSQLAASQAKAEQLQRRLRGGDVAVRAERVAAQLEAVRDAEAQVEALRAELASVKASAAVGAMSPSVKVQEQERTIDELRAQLATAQAALASHDARVAQQRQSDVDDQSMGSALQAARTAAEDASRRATAAEAALRRERAVAAETLSAERSARQAAEAALRRGAGGAAALGAPTAAAFTALKQRLDACEATLAEVTRQRDAAQAELANVSLAEVERLQTEIEDDLAASREAETLRSRVDALTQQLQRVQESSAAAEERAMAAEQEVEELRSTMSSETTAATASAASSSALAAAEEEARVLRAALDREKARARETEEALLAEAQAQAQTASAMTAQLEVATAALLEAQAALTREKQNARAEVAEANSGMALAVDVEAHVRQFQAALQAVEPHVLVLRRVKTECVELHDAFEALAARLRTAENAHAEFQAAAAAREAALEADVSSLAEEAEAAHAHAAAVDARAEEAQSALSEALSQLAVTRQALSGKPPPGADAAAIMAAREATRASERARYEKQLSQRLQMADDKWQAERAALAQAAASADALAAEVVSARAAAEEARVEAAALRQELDAVQATLRTRGNTSIHEDDTITAVVDASQHDTHYGNGSAVGAQATPPPGDTEEVVALRAALAAIASQRAAAEAQAQAAEQRAAQAASAAEVQQKLCEELRVQLEQSRSAMESFCNQYGVFVEERERDAALAAAEKLAAAAAVDVSEVEGNNGGDNEFLTHDDLQDATGADTSNGDDAALAEFVRAADALKLRMTHAASVPVSQWGAHIPS